MRLHHLRGFGPFPDISGSTRRSWVGSMVILVSSLFGTGSASAQEAPQLQGRVIDATSTAAIAGAVISLWNSGIEARTDETGHFSVPGALPGTYIVRVHASGYVDVLEEIELRPEASLFLSVPLPPIAAVLDELIVTADSDRARGAPSETMTAADLIARQVLGASVTPRAGGEQIRSFTLRGRGSITLGGEPAVYLDGMRIGATLDQALDILAQIPAVEVEQVQILRGPATTTVTGDPDGVILVTRRTGGRD